MGQLWLANNTYGGWLTNPRLSKTLRYALTPVCKFRQFCDVKEGWGKGVGDTLYFNKISKAVTAGAALVSTTAIPETAFKIARGTISITEYGNSIPFTGKLESLAEFNVNDPIQRVLRDDAAEVLDHVAGLQFRRTRVKYICSSTALTKCFQTRADATTSTLATAATAKGGWRLFHIREVVNQLKRYNVPKYDGKTIRLAA